MEQYDDIKKELQQEWQDLQQKVEQHSTFNSDVWRNTVKKSSSELYWQSTVFSGLLLVIMAAGTVALALIKWPWWLILLFNLYFGWLLVDSLIATIALRKADVQSREGLLSLRESINIYSKRKHTIIRIIGILLFVVFEGFLLFYDRSAFFSMLIFGGLLFFPFGSKETRRSTKPYDKLSKEIDELLEE